MLPVTLSYVLTPGTVISTCMHLLGILTKVMHVRGLRNPVVLGGFPGKAAVSGPPSRQAVSKSGLIPAPPVNASAFTAAFLSQGASMQDEELAPTAPHLLLGPSFFFEKNFNGLVDLQCCVNFCCTAK